MKFIKLNALSSSTIDGDSVLHLRVDKIVAVETASDLNKKQRPELESMVHTIGGHQYGVLEKAEDVLATLEDLSL